MELEIEKLGVEGSVNHRPHDISVLWRPSESETFLSPFYSALGTIRTESVLPSYCSRWDQTLGGSSFQVSDIWMLGPLLVFQTFGCFAGRIRRCALLKEALTGHRLRFQKTPF